MLAIVMSCAALLFGVKAYDHGNTEIPDVPAIPSVVSASAATRSSLTKPAAAQPSEAHLEGEVITLRRTGFDPQEIHQRHGHFVLIFENRSELDNLQLNLDRVTGNRIHQVTGKLDRPDWIQEVNLPPGDYTLTEASHPQWVCHLTITPQ